LYGLPLSSVSSDYIHQYTAQKHQYCHSSNLKKKTVIQTLSMHCLKQCTHVAIHAK